jgi:glycosyltransferase involved in cell wall biosynthesis
VAWWEVGTLARPETDRLSYLVGLDVTPLHSGHSIRGIGRYVRGIVDALLSTQAGWCADHLGLLATASQDVPPGARAVWRSRRASFRAQDIGWLVSAAMDRATARGLQVDLWHEMDPANPLGAAGPDHAMVTAYDLIPLLEPDVMRRIRRHRRLPYQLYLRRLQSARAVVAISQATATDVHSILGVPEERIHVVYPAVQALLPTDASSAPEVAVEPSLLFVAVPDPHKRAELAIEALAAYRGRGGTRRLVFVGYHSPETRSRLQRCADLKHVGSEVEFWDRVDDGTLADLYRIGIVLAVSSREGFGLPPVECLLTGGRVVATPTPIYREVLGSAAVFAVDDSADAVAEGIRHAEETKPDESAVKGLAARYSPASVSATLMRAYESALP